MSAQTTGIRCLFGFNCAGGASCFCLRAFICAQILGLCVAGERRNGEDSTVWSSVVDIEEGRCKSSRFRGPATRTHRNCCQTRRLRGRTSVATNHAEGPSNAGVKQPAMCLRPITIMSGLTNQPRNCSITAPPPGDLCRLARWSGVTAV